MKPCGFIATYISRQDWRGKPFWIKLRTIIFNIVIFVFQLAFMIVGTTYGKIKWPDPQVAVKALSIIGYFVALIGMSASILAGNWYLFFLNFIMIVNFIASYRGIPWRRVWRAAQVLHVRLCLKDVGVSRKLHIVYEYINFGYPKAKLQDWRMDMIDGKRFRYFDPTFSPSPEFIEAMIEYAEAQVGKSYDKLQLFSYALNFIIWLFWWKWWGQEKLKWLNMRGALEVCSSGVTADLRWADWKSGGLLIGRLNSRFFNLYDTAMVSPCLFALSKDWKET